MRTAWKKIRYRLEWLGLKAATKFVPLLSRKACCRLALLLGSPRCHAFDHIEGVEKVSIDVR
jgi:hypothetical protein